MKKILNFKYLIPILSGSILNSIRNSRRGFTLIELILYMGMLSILLAVLSQVFVSILDIQLESKSTSSVEQDSSYILSRLIYDINRADTNIITPTNLGDSGSTLQIMIDNVSYTYASSSGNLQVTDNTGISDNLNSFDTNIDYLNFKRLGNLSGDNSIRITLILSGKTIRESGKETKTIQTTVGTRDNKPTPTP